MQQLGDARTGKLAGNMASFGRALRRAGVRTDAARIALAAEAAMLVGVDDRFDFAAARWEIVMFSREQDRVVFQALLAAWFREARPAEDHHQQMLPSAEGKARAIKRACARSQALAAPRAKVMPAQTEREVEFDAAMTASDRQRMQHADFNALGAAEYQLVERLARDIALPVPKLPARRLRVASGADAFAHALARRAARGGAHRRRELIPPAAPGAPQAAAAVVGAGRCLGLDGALLPAARLPPCGDAP